MILPCRKDTNLTPYLGRLFLAEALIMKFKGYNLSPPVVKQAGFFIFCVVVKKK